MMNFFEDRSRQRKALKETESSTAGKADAEIEQVKSPSETTVYVHALAKKKSQSDSIHQSRSDISERKQFNSAQENRMSDSESSFSSSIHSISDSPSEDEVETRRSPCKRWKLPPPQRAQLDGSPASSSSWQSRRLV